MAAGKLLRRSAVGLQLNLAHSRVHRARHSKLPQQMVCPGTRSDTVGCQDAGSRLLVDALVRGRQHAEQLYRKSIQLQLEGDPLGSTSHYVQAMECAIGAVQSTAYELPSTPWPVCLPVTLANRVFRSLADAPQPSSFTMFFKDYGIGRAPRPGIYKIM